MLEETQSQLTRFNPRQVRPAVACIHTLILSVEYSVATVWEVNTPRSKAIRPCPGRSDTAMIAILSEMRVALPDFQSVVTHEHLCRLNNPAPLSLEIADTGEKAYQRAFFLARSTRIRGSREGIIDAAWLDIEVPVVNNNSPRRPCLDMIGHVQGTPSMIVELKKAGGQSPFHAIREVISYAQCAQNNHLSLKSHPKFMASGKSGIIPEYWPEYKGKYLVVGGPDLYWNRWMPHLDVIAAAGVKWLRNSSLHGHHLMFVTYPSENFEEQKGSDTKYTPQPLTSDWAVFFEACFSG
jgi:hypothetical protein